MIIYLEMLTDRCLAGHPNFGSSKGLESASRDHLGISLFAFSSFPRRGHNSEVFPNLVSLVLFVLFALFSFSREDSLVSISH